MSAQEVQCCVQPPRAEPQSPSNSDFSPHRQEWSMPLEVGSSPLGEVCKHRAFLNPLQGDTQAAWESGCVSREHRVEASGWGWVVERIRPSSRKENNGRCLLSGYSVRVLRVSHGDSCSLAWGGAVLGSAMIWAGLGAAGKEVWGPWGGSSSDSSHRREPFLQVLRPGGSAPGIRQSVLRYWEAQIGQHLRATRSLCSLTLYLPTRVTPVVALPWVSWVPRICAGSALRWQSWAAGSSHLPGVRGQGDPSGFPKALTTEKQTCLLKECDAPLITIRQEWSPSSQAPRAANCHTVPSCCPLLPQAGGGRWVDG